MQPTIILIIVVLLAFVFALTHAHICILNPPQRGTLSIDEPGSSACFRRTPYCGGVTPPNSPPSGNTFTAGQQLAILFQQNLNHWNGPKPGFFDAAISYDVISNPSNPTWNALGSQLPDFPANDMVWQTNLTFPVTLPMTPCAHCVLRLRYFSYNSLEVYPSNNTDAVFYNCADIAIVAAPPSSNAAAIKFQQQPQRASDKDDATSAAAAPSCCAPKQFEALATQDTALGRVSHHIYYDSINQLVRWDRYGAVENSSVLQLVTISNYTDLANGPPEYVIYPSMGQCEIYGADLFYEWCFGAQRGQQYFGNATFGSRTVMEFTTAALGMSWYADANCAPFQFEQLGELKMSFTILSLKVSPSVFIPPAYCFGSSLVRHRSCRAPNPMI